MKKILNFSTIILLVLLFSCDMDRFPEDDIALGNSFQTIDDATSWNNGMLASFRARQYGKYARTQDRQADMINATSDFGNRGGAPHGWINFLAGDYDLRDVWKGYYKALKNVNFFIKQAESLKLEGEEAAALEIYKGNAHFIRAYYYLNLAIRYGNPYNASSASSDLSVPLVTEYDVNAKPARATNEEVYKFILAEIDLAKGLLGGVEGKPMASEITKDAVVALEARTKLYMSDWAGAYAAAIKLVNSGTYPLVSATEESFVNMWQNDNSTEEILQMYVSKPDELPNTIGGFGADASKHVCRPDWLPSQWVIDLYKDTDLRRNVYFDPNQITEFGGLFYKNISVMSKFKGNPALAATEDDPVWGYIPDGRQAPKVFRIAEMYLIAAEAGFEAKKGDAVDYLNKLRSSRGLEAVASSGAQLLSDIREERTRELAFEGFRLWDLRRWGMSMKRHNPQLATVVLNNLKDKVESPAPNAYGHLAKGPNGYYTLEIGVSNPKWIWGIPTNDIKVNTNLVQNPGW